jgi:hypothetical protein
MVHVGTRRPMLVSWAVRRAQVLSNAIHRSLAQGRLSWNPGSLSKENLTVPRNDLYDIYGTSLGEQGLPSSYKKPVIAAVNPLERIQCSANEKDGTNVHSCSMNLAHSADNAKENEV